MVFGLFGGRRRKPHPLGDEQWRARLPLAHRETLDILESAPEVNHLHLRRYRSALRFARTDEALECLRGWIIPSVSKETYEKIKAAGSDTNWATRKELFKADIIPHRDEAPIDRMVVGHLPSDQHPGHHYEVPFSGDGHLLTVAPTGAGKSQRYILPNTFHYTGPMVIFDPKGEIYKETAWFRSWKGPVFKFAPFDDEGDSDSFNPLSFISDWDDARVLADLLMVAPTSGDDFWFSSARDLVRAFIMLLCERSRLGRMAAWYAENKPADPGGPDASAPWQSEADMPINTRQHPDDDAEAAAKRARNLEQGKAATEQCEAIGIEPGYEAAMRDLMRQLAPSETEFEALLDEMRLLGDEALVEQANSLEQMGEKMRSSIYQSARAQLDAWRSPAVSRVTEHTTDGMSAFDLITDAYMEEMLADQGIDSLGYRWTEEGNLMRGQAGTIYVIIPPEKVASYRSLLRVVLGMQVHLAQKARIGERTPRLKRPLTMVLDELPQLGYMELIANAVGVARGAGIRLWMFVQDLAQLKHAYPQWESILANCRCQVYFQPADLGTAEYISRLLGTRTDVLGETALLATPQELMGPSFDGKAVVMLSNAKPIKADLPPPYYADPLPKEIKEGVDEAFRTPSRERGGGN